MKTRQLMLLAIATSWPLNAVLAQQASQNSPQERQENRQERREERQERREDRQQRRNQQGRAEQRENSRASYYDQESLGRLDPWLQRNNVSRLERLSQVANAAVRVTEKALNTAANAAETLSDSAQSQRFGYDNPNGPGETGWFYDYYSYSPTYYRSTGAESQVYSAARQYYDLDNDGVYDSLSVFRDTNQDSSFDAFDRFDFDAADDSGRSSEALDWPADARRHAVAGQLYASKSVRVNGVEHLVVRLSNRQADARQAEARQQEVPVTIVDLGPLAAWKNRQYKAGDQISASGPLKSVGDKLILIADSAKLGDNKEMPIDRAAPKLQGQVVEVTQNQVRGVHHTLAVVESDSMRQIVDLGPTENLKVQVQPQNQITVRGVRVKAGDYGILQADQIEVEGQQFDINP